MTRWDVFLSHSHTDEGITARIADALRAAGLRVFRAADDLDTFSSISPTVLRALRESTLLLAYYSAGYATRPACQYEFATAYLAGQAEGDPLGRVVAINPERSFAHVEPRQLRDALLPGRPASSAGLTAVVAAVSAKVAARTGPIGTAGPARVPWLAGRPVHPPDDFVGRWSHLWWLHSALHPDIAPLTSPPTAPVVVVHGVAGIGKTALAAQYAAQFGAAFPDGVVWCDPGEPTPQVGTGTRCLWVFDDIAGAADLRARLPPDPAAPCLVLTRDARLARSGHAMELTDLNEFDARRLIADRVDADADAVGRILVATRGSPEIAARVAELAAERGVDVAVTELHAPITDLARPLERRLAPVFDALDEHGWDVLRVLAAAAPLAVSVPVLADVLGAARGTDRLTEIEPTQRAVTDLLGAGALPGHPDAVDLTMPNAFRLVVRRLDRDPARAEELRALTVRALDRDPRAGQPLSPAIPPRSEFDEAERLAAHRVQIELLNRVTGRPLPHDEGSLREALSSLRALLEITRTTQASLHPAALRESTSTRPGFGTLADRLVNDVLRRLLTRWHVELGAYEDQRPPDVSRINHERGWTQHDELRRELGALHDEAVEIATELSVITGNTLGLPER